MIDKHYRGRFAPTPSGGMHFGSLVTALASYLDAKAANGTWLVRIEDIDPLREVKGASDQILQVLTTFGFEWDESIVYQSTRLDAYEAIVQQLYKMGLAYACTCSRKQLEHYSVYPNFCRDACQSPSNASIRIRVPDLSYAFVDRVQGRFVQHLGRDVGDFIIKRREGFYAYQLAVIIDDAMQGVTDVVRGADLLDSTPRQLYLQELLGFSQPRYLHVPLLIQSDGHKLSKSKSAPEIATKQAATLLIKALKLLGQYVENKLADERPKEILQWAIAHWQTSLIPNDIHIQLENR